MAAQDAAQSPSVVFVAVDPSSRALVNDIRQVAAHPDISVGFIGPRGCGKTTLARLFHSLSARKDEPFRAINVASLPASIAEAEIFGTSKGGFSDARDKAGLLELAGEGTLFLDELAECDPALQVKLNYVIETGVFTRVGEQARERRVRCRILTATHSPDKLRDDVRDRFNIWLEIAPLNRRRDDIAPLAEHFLSLHAPGWRWSQRALNWLGDADWPGDARQLGNLVQQLVVLADEPTRKRRMIDVDLVIKHGPSPRPRATAGVRGALSPDVVAAELSAQHPEGWTRQQFEDAWLEEVSSRTARRRLASLVNDGLVFKTGQSTLTRYHIAGQIAGQSLASVQPCPAILSSPETEGGTE